MFHQSFFGGFLVQLEWDNQIRSEHTRKFSRENNRIVTKRTLGCRHRCISDDFSTAGLADIGTQSICLAFLPFSASFGFPLHAVAFAFLQLFIHRLQCFHLKF